MAKKPSLGRQKIKIAKIENKNHLQVTFSKRRVGLFKKASELVTLCGVEIAIIVSSPGGKLFSFGHPNLEFVLDKFLNHSSIPSKFALSDFSETGFKDSYVILGQQLEQISDELESEKKRGEILDNMRKDGEKSCWWRAPIDKLCVNELEQVRVLMEELKKNVVNEANRHLVEGLESEVDQLSPSFNSSDEKIPCQIFGFSENYTSLDYLGYGHGFC